MTQQLERSAASCPRMCGGELHQTWPSEPFICRTCGYEDYAAYTERSLEASLTTDEITALRAAAPGTATGDDLQPKRRRRYARGDEWLRDNAPDIPLTYERTRGRPRLADSVGAAFMELVDTHNVNPQDIGDYYGVSRMTVISVIKRVR